MKIDESWTCILFCFSRRFMELQQSRAVDSGSLKEKKLLVLKKMLSLKNI